LSGVPVRKNGDLALVLYGVPFIVSFAYAMYLWAGQGLSSTLPSAVYDEVTQNPYVFLVGFFGVLAGGLVDFSSEEPTARRGAVMALSKRLQAIAFLTLVLGAICAWYSAGFDLSNGALYLVEGRYTLIFPALLIVFSFLIVPSVRFQGVSWSNLIAIVLLIASPVGAYEVGKRNTDAGLGIALTMLLLAVFLLVRGKNQE
jgi:hypothetical protein